MSSLFPNYSTGPLSFHILLIRSPLLKPHRSPFLITLHLVHTSIYLSNSPLMAKLRFRLRISRVIPSFNCRSKESTKTAPSNPISRTTTSYMHSPFHHLRRHQPPVVSNSGKCCSTRLHHHHHRSPRPASSSGGEADAEADDLPLTKRIHATTYLWTKSEKWHIVCCASSENSTSSSPPRSKIDYNLFSCRNPRCTRESDSSGDDSGWFSTDDEYMYDNYCNNTYESFSITSGATSCFAVCKVSADPRGDFRRSIAEMIAEKGIYDVNELRRLLHCFLSLNDRRHRQAILAAFADVWYAIFPSVALASTFPKMFYRC